MFFSFPGDGGFVSFNFRAPAGWHRFSFGLPSGRSPALRGKNRTFSTGDWRFHCHSTAALHRPWRKNCTLISI
jgi:hypothetical protein